MAMENGGGMSPADYAAISNNGFGDNSFFWVFALLLLGGGGFGNWGGGNNAVADLNADMQRGFDTQNLQAQTRDILAAVTGGTAQTIAASTQNAQNAINAIKDGNAALIREFGNVETALTALGGKQQECCCNILRATDQVRYDGAVNTAAINANTTAQVQKVLDAIVGNRMADMQSQINALQLQAATAGMMKFPNAWTFNGGYFPPLQPAATAAG